MKLRINWFEIVYLAIALATFQHTMWAGATVFEGPMPETFQSTEWWRWHFNGALLAIAIDIGMLVTARQLRQSFGKPMSWKLTMSTAFVVAAIASFYTQILFSVHHTNQLAIGSGVSTYWNEYLDPIIQARVILVPLMLPLFAVIFTLASIITHTTEAVEEQQQQRIIIQEQQAKKLPPPVYTFRGKNKTWTFDTLEKRDKFAAMYKRKMDARERRKLNANNNGHTPLIELGTADNDDEDIDDENYEIDDTGTAGLSISGTIHRS